MTLCYRVVFFCCFFPPKGSPFVLSRKRLLAPLILFLGMLPPKAVCLVPPTCYVTPPPRIGLLITPVTPQKQHRMKQVLPLLLMPSRPASGCNSAHMGCNKAARNV